MKFNILPQHLFVYILSCTLASLLFSCQDKEENKLPAGQELPEITAPEGFEVNLLYSPSAMGQGSWVSLTTDDKGRLIASDQYGRIYRITVTGNEVEIDNTDLGIGSAQGLLYAHGGLYVSVNAREDSTHRGSGLYKLTDTNDDDNFDTVTQLVNLEGEGEHGPHAVILGPDGNTLYLIAGNHTLVPDNFGSVLNKNWKTDRLFSSVLDPRGHANNIEPPGGWIARSGDRGETWEVIASGFRNAYDIAFNANGDLFTYDSDMEWDLGTPWYRPTRICHVIPGAEFGWRTGSGKWPAYYPDNLPPVLDMGQGSPTGISFGYGAAFPESFQTSLFVSDWSFGTMYQITLKPQGATYSAEKKEFISGTPLPISDVVIAGDGNMYFTTGGRRGTSFLYQVRYTGEESVESAQMRPNVAEERQMMKTMFEPAVSTEFAFRGLAQSDRFLRYASRVALEKKPFAEWKQEFSNATDPGTIIQASIAAIHQNDQSLTPLVSQKLMSIKAGELPLEDQLGLVRTWALLFARTGNKDRNVISALPEFPSGNAALDRELAELHAYLGNGRIIGPALDLMEESEQSIEAELTPVEVLDRSEQYGPVIKAMHENRPAEQGLALALALSHLENGWTTDLRDRYFRWFYRALQKSGGMSYKGFAEFIRLQALENVPEDDRKRLAEVSGEALLNQPSFASDVPPPVGPGRNWIISEASGVVNNNIEDADLGRGEELYKGLLCEACHAINGEGGNVGPDLTQAGTRFSSYDLLLSLISPSSSISDQYGATLYSFTDGSTIVGRTVRTTDDSVFINTNPFSMDVRGVARENIENENPSPVSLMPAGLINSLNENELRDLIAYLRAEH